MRGLIWETKQEWEWCLGKSPMTSIRVLSLLYCSRTATILQPNSIQQSSAATASNNGNAGVDIADTADFSLHVEITLYRCGVNVTIN